MQFAFVEAGWTRGRVLRVMLIVAVAYYVGARLGLALTMHTQPVSTLWPPNAILLAALLLTPPRIWPFVLLGALPAHLFVELTSGIPPLMVLSWFVSNSSEALIGAAGMRLVDRSPRLDSLRRAASGTENTMPSILDAVRAYATLGEICAALRDVFGSHKESPSI